MRTRTCGAAIIVAAVATAIVAVPQSTLASGDTIVVTTTIQAAVDAADLGDTVVVPDGTYGESVLVSEPGITIRGSRAAVLDGAGLDLPYGIRVRSPDGSRLDGFTLDGLTIRGYSRYGSQVSGVDNFRLTGTRYIDNPLYGLFPVRCSHGRVDHNEVSGSFDSGVYVGQCSDVLVDDNVAHDNTIGLEVELSSRGRRGQRLDRDAIGAVVEDLAAGPVKATEDVLVRRNVRWQQPARHHRRRESSGFLPGGVGMNVAGDHVRILDNVVSGNRSAGIGMVGLPALSRLSTLPWTRSRTVARSAATSPEATATTPTLGWRRPRSRRRIDLTEVHASSSIGHAHLPPCTTELCMKTRTLT